MGRPKASAKQQMRAYELFKIGMATEAIVGFLELAYPKPVSKRTVARWVRSFKLASMSDLESDSPFRWHQMESYDLPWEASGFLLTLATLFRDIQKDFPSDWPKMPFTLRQARWSWRVHLAASDLSPNRVIDVAQMFVQREIASTVLGSPEDMDELDAYLEYAPWRGEKEYDEYQSAIGDSRIKPLPEQSVWISELETLVEEFGVPAWPVVSDFLTMPLMDEKQIRQLLEEMAQAIHLAATRIRAAKEGVQVEETSREIRSRQVAP